MGSSIGFSCVRGWIAELDLNRDAGTPVPQRAVPSVLADAATIKAKYTGVAIRDRVATPLPCGKAYASTISDRSEHLYFQAARCWHDRA